MRAVVQRFVLVGTGTVEGRLLDLGEYPGLVLDGAVHPVSGYVYAFPAEILPALDAYESFDPGDEEHSLFVRRLISVTMADGQTGKHWIYLFSRPAPSSFGL